MAYADAQPVFGTPVPKVWNAVPQRSVFGDIVIVVFLLSQVFDGAFTYLGIMTFGTGIEANPLIIALMTHLGHGAALMIAKIVAASLGIGLHLRGTHAAVAALAVFYVAVAVLPWTVILFF
jgi:hypothetical protein